MRGPSLALANMGRAASPWYEANPHTDGKHLPDFESKARVVIRRFIVSLEKLEPSRSCVSALQPPMR